MREILFKAKRLEDGEWIEGYYCSYETIERTGERCKYHYILNHEFADWPTPIPINSYEIDPNTLCQSTGLIDKDGNKIWENDIVDLSDCWWDASGVERHLVVWDEFKGGFFPFVCYDTERGIYYFPHSSKVIDNRFNS